MGVLIPLLGPGRKGIGPDMMAETAGYFQNRFQKSLRLSGSEQQISGQMVVALCKHKALPKAVLGEKLYELACSLDNYWSPKELLNARGKKDRGMRTMKWRRSEKTQNPRARITTEQSITADSHLRYPSSGKQHAKNSIAEFPLSILRVSRTMS
jgi:hypothetical protein